MAYKLPPLNTLRMFEAAGRRASFKRAAEELNVTPSAVSHGVATLEGWLGVKLFHRDPHGLRLSPAGHDYLPQVTDALARLSQATDRLAAKKPTGKISVSVAPTFAARWLVPRLPGFVVKRPDVSITVDTSREQRDLSLDGIDLAIRLSRERGKRGRWTRLVREEWVPVCAPKLLSRLGEGSWSDLVSRTTLLHVTTVTDDWAAYFAASGAPSPSFAAGVRLDTIQMAIEAATQGLGIALGRLPLIDQDLRERRLVMLDAPHILGCASYWLVGSSEQFERPDVRSFRNWLVKELRA